jgi:NhaA family Na+:H+ antiporter
MTIFFFINGLELEEIYEGELSNIKDALLPIFAALGGMLVPAGLYLLNYGGIAAGAGILWQLHCFALGILSLGNRVPLSLKIFLTALAVIDDLERLWLLPFYENHSLV